MKSLLTSILSYYFLIFFACGCQKSRDSIAKPSSSIDTIFKIPHPFQSVINNVRNPEFQKRDSGQILPIGWRGRFPYSFYDFLSVNSNKLGWSKNSSGSYLITQRLHLKRDCFYKVSAIVDYRINDYSAGGIFIMDRTMKRLVGKVDRFNSAGKEKMEFVFNTGSDSIYHFAMGFPEGMNATITFENPQVIEYKFNPSVRNSFFSQYLIKRYKLSFTKQNFDLSVQNISDYINYILLARHEGRNVDIEGLLDYLNPNEYHFLTKCLRDIDNIDDAYCQKASLSLGEILTNEFNIPTRQIHINSLGIGIHQFIEYWNPYSESWVALDPYFASAYMKNGAFVGISKIDKSDPVSQMRKIGTYSFAPNFDEARVIWGLEDQLEISGNYFISYPFGGTMVPIPEHSSGLYK